MVASSLGINERVVNYKRPAGADVWETLPINAPTSSASTSFHDFDTDASLQHNYAVHARPPQEVAHVGPHDYGLGID